MNEQLRLRKRGIWGGYTIEKIGGYKPYFWIGEGDKYLMSLTTTEAERLARFLLAKVKEGK
jgi:hypothetical protein